MPIEAPVNINSDSDDENDESIGSYDDDEEVNISIHFHCEHCFKISRCNEKPKDGFCCEIIRCPQDCGHRLHGCKLDEHRLLCSNQRVPCLNKSFGCSAVMARRQIGDHLPVCPASVVVCNAEWNRWSLGAKEREKVTIGKNITSQYEPKNIDMALALHDQELVNEMQAMPKDLRMTMCNGITRRFPSLPLSIRGSRHAVDTAMTQNNKGATVPNHKEHDEEDALTPGLSVSVCTELLKGSSTNPTNSFLPTNSNLPEKRSRKKNKKSKANSDDISEFLCCHMILKDICMFCKDKPADPDVKLGQVWRERMIPQSPGIIKWVQESTVEKVKKVTPLGKTIYVKPSESDSEEESDEEAEESARISDLILDDQGKPMGKRCRFTTPPPAPLTPSGLTMELSLKHYSRHQTKPRAMFTFQCMQEMRRDEFSAHFKNVHSEVQEGLEGWLLHRCPMHIYGCPYAYNRLHPGHTDSNVVFCHNLRAFGVQPVLDYHADGAVGLPRSCSPSKGKSSHQEVGKVSQELGNVRLNPKKKSAKSAETSNQYFSSSMHITFLPVEILINIAKFLDGFSLNNLSLSCQLFRTVSMSLLNERGLVIYEWVRYADQDGRLRWRQGKKRRFFSKAFEHVKHWGIKDHPHMGDHLKVCPFNKRHVAEEKFQYAQFNESPDSVLNKLRHNQSNNGYGI